MVIRKWLVDSVDRDEGVKEFKKVGLEYSNDLSDNLYKEYLKADTEITKGQDQSRNQKYKTCYTT